MHEIPKLKTLVLVVGQPATGKKTWLARNVIGQGQRGVCVITENRPDHRPTKGHRARARKDADTMLLGGSRVVYTDVACRTEGQRAIWRRLAEKHGASVRTVYVVCDEDTRRKRLRQRGVTSPSGWTLRLDPPPDPMEIVDTSE